MVFRTISFVGGVFTNNEPLKICIVFGITILFLGTLIAPSVALENVKKSSAIISNGNTLYVGGTGEGNYTSIQDAIDNASNGDTVFVYDDSSPYHEYIKINKSITLIGEDKNTTIIEYYEEDEIVYITGSNVVLTGFTIQNTDEGFPYTDGIHLVSNNCMIINNIMKNNYNGIFIKYGNNNIIKNNNLVYNVVGIFFYDRDEYCFNNHVTENFIAHNYECGLMDFDYDYGTIATWNVIADNAKIKPSLHAGGISKEDSYGVFHHNDIFLNNGNVNVGISKHGSSWDDGSEGNYWDDWKSNPGYPDTYIIPKEPYEADDIDYHPSPIPFMESLVVSIECYPYYALVDEPIDFMAYTNVDSHSVSWLWDFGDGNTSDEISPSYSYSSTGHYYLNVTITDNNGHSDTSNSEAYIGRPPEKPTITGPTWFLRKNVQYYYNIRANDPDGDDIYYHIDWGDMIEEIIGPYPSGEIIEASHTWYYFRYNFITVTPRDTSDMVGEEAILNIHIERDYSRFSYYYLRLFIECFPLLEKLLNLVR